MRRICLRLCVDELEGVVGAVSGVLDCCFRRHTRDSDSYRGCSQCRLPTNTYSVIAIHHISPPTGSSMAPFARDVDDRIRGSRVARGDTPSWAPSRRCSTPTTALWQREVLGSVRKTRRSIAFAVRLRTGAIGLVAGLA